MQKNFRSPFQGLASREHTAVRPFLVSFLRHSVGTNFNFKILSKISCSQRTSGIICTNCNNFRLCEAVGICVHFAVIQSTEISFGRNPIKVVYCFLSFIAALGREKWWLYSTTHQEKTSLIWGVTVLRGSWRWIDHTSR